METTEIIDTLATQAAQQTPYWADYNIADYFLNGGIGPMCIITLFLIGVLVSAWKAPAWVRDFGFGAVIASLCWVVFDLCQMFQAMEWYGAYSANILGGGLWRMLTPLVYAMLIYLLSILISTFQKPRI